MNETTVTNHAGLIIPADMFRLSQIAAIYAEILVGKARNILDAELVVSRHKSAPILLFRIVGSVVEDNPPQFWRDNADLISVTSRAFPRQVIMYYVEAETPEERREGFLVAQQGQVIASDDASPERPPAEPGVWPVAKLCQQLRIHPDELASGFADGPSVSVKLVEPQVDDQALLMELFAQEAAAAGAEADGVATAAPEGDGVTADGAPPAPAAPPQPKKPTATQIAEEDKKRRLKEQAEEEAEQKRRADEVKSGLEYQVDDLGVVAVPKAELGEADILQPFIKSKLVGDLPDGLPRELAEKLQGKRLDIAVKVDFLSEVFIESVPLTRPMFEERAEEVSVDGRTVKAIEVLGPRLGYGTLVSAGKAPYIFVSRKRELALPEALIAKMLA